MSSTQLETASTAPAEGEPEYVYFHYDGFYGNKREVLKGAKAKKTFTSIPIIDFSGMYSEDPTERQRIADEIAQAAQDCGFFFLTNHGVDQQLIDDTYAAAKEYFDQPLDKKMEQWIYKNPGLKGYEPVHGARLDDKTKGDGKESFLIAYEPDTDPTPPVLTPAQRALHYENQWPPNQDAFRAQLTRYNARLTLLARKLMQSFALGLGVEETFFDKGVTAPTSNIKIIHYPPTPEDAVDETGIGAHTDFTAFTILSQDSVGGLEVLNANAHWVEATPIPGTFVVNIGDFMMRVSNDRFVSTVHRVKKVVGRDRYSIPYFFAQNHDTMLEVVPTCQSEENPPKYEPITAGDYYEYRHEIQRKGFKERGYGH